MLELFKIGHGKPGPKQRRLKIEPGIAALALHGSSVNSTLLESCYVSDIRYSVLMKASRLSASQENP
jgi:hypothetical protein